MHLITIIKNPGNDCGIVLWSVSLQKDWSIHHGYSSHRDVVLDCYPLAFQDSLFGSPDVSLVVPYMFITTSNEKAYFNILKIKWNTETNIHLNKLRISEQMYTFAHIQCHMAIWPICMQNQFAKMVYRYSKDHKIVYLEKKCFVFPMYFNRQSHL